jgi:hypothetical protein
LFLQELKNYRRKRWLRQQASEAGKTFFSSNVWCFILSWLCSGFFFVLSRRVYIEKGWSAKQKEAAVPLPKFKMVPRCGQRAPKFPANPLCLLGSPRGNQSILRHCVENGDGTGAVWILRRIGRQRISQNVIRPYRVKSLLLGLFIYQQTPRLMNQICCFYHFANGCCYGVLYGRILPTEFLKAPQRLPIACIFRSRDIVEASP